MRGWYNIHDHANTRFGFVPFKGSEKSPAIRATTTPRTALSFNTPDFDGFVTYQHGMKGSKIALIVCLTLASVAGISILIWQLTKNSTKERETKIRHLTSEEIKGMIDSLQAGNQLL